MGGKLNTISHKDFSMVDLFCGVGGLSHGFVMENFNVVAGIDFDKTCEYTFEKNNKTKFVHADVNTIDIKKILDLYPERSKKILVGCAPCQPFSLYSHTRKSENEKWKLLYSFSRIIKEMRPEIVSMENVPQLKKYDNGKVFNDFVNELKSEGYTVTHYVVNAQNYGVPQRRKRLILFASLYGEIKIIPETHKNRFITVKEAIGDLPVIEDGIVYKKDKLHYARKLSDINKKRIMATPLGGRWRDWQDKSLILKCHRKKSGKSFGSVYGRMLWDDVAPTMTTCCVGLGNGRFGHPDQNRAISLREAAILQSFPNNYDFIDPKLEFSTTRIARHIGNAVPVRLGEVIAKSIKNHIKGLNGR